jgi:hypothetical protein
MPEAICVTSVKWSFHGLSKIASRMNRKKRFILIIPFVFLSLSLICRCGQEYESVAHEKEDGTITVRFVYIDDSAATVCVLGSFNSWSEQSDRLSRSGDTWSTSVSLLPGRYQYIFLVDGHNWREDPGAGLTEDSGFGTKNSVLIVE